MLSKSRPPILPKLATAHEQGLADFGAYFWDGIFLPKRTPSLIAQKLHAATIAALDTAAIAFSQNREQNRRSSDCVPHVRLPFDRCTAPC